MGGIFKSYLGEFFDNVVYEGSCDVKLTICDIYGTLTLNDTWRLI